MKTVNYKGNSYQYKVLGTTEGERQFSLYNDQGLLVHFVSESQLDKKKNFSNRFLSNIIHAYYRTIMEEQPSLLR